MRDWRGALIMAWNEFFWYMPYAEWLWRARCRLCDNRIPYPDNICGECYLADQWSDYYAAIR